MQRRRFLASSLKHFALNNQEFKRFSSNSLADERTMREIYLSAFETAVCHGKPSTVMCGGVVELPFINRIKGLLYLGLPGEAGGEAVKDLLFGYADPCGRLAETWPVCYEDCICSGYYGTRDAQYREGIYVGYRYYESADVRVRFPFGYGLSYTEFTYSQFHAEGNRVFCEVENTVMEMMETSLLMRLIYRGAEFVLTKKYGGKDDSNPEFKMMLIMSMDC